MKTLSNSGENKNNKFDLKNQKTLAIFLPSHYGNQRLDHAGNHCFTEYITKEFDHPQKKSKDIFQDPDSPLKELDQTKKLRSISYFLPVEEKLEHLITYRNVNKDLDEQTIEITPNYDLHLVKELEFQHVEEEYSTSLVKTISDCLTFLEKKHIPFKLIEIEQEKRHKHFELKEFTPILTYGGKGCDIIPNTTLENAHSESTYEILKKYI